MDVNKINELAQHLDAVEAEKFPTIIDQLQTFYLNTTDIQALGTGIQRLGSSIMFMKDPPVEIIPYLEQIIKDIIITSIRNEFSVGFDAMRCIFDSNSSFYKSAHHDPHLQYPLGHQRPIQTYQPKIGQTCDVIRPYITSTSYCGWTRCNVISFQNAKYTVQYLNSQEPTTIRQNPVFAPEGSRTTDFQWRQSLQIGSPIDSIKNRVWYSSTIAEINVTEKGMKMARVTFRRFSQEGDRIDTMGNKFFGLDGGEDEIMEIYSVRIQKPGTIVNKSLCYYTATCQQPLPDDTYDILFMKEYNQRPFHSIMRVIFNKSLSYIAFMNTFVEYEGIETLLKRLDNPNVPLDASYEVLISIGNMSHFIPRMETWRYKDLYDRIYNLFLENVKSHTVQRLEYSYYCFDLLGRRLFSLTQVYAHQRKIKQILALEFLQMNMEKQMLALRYLYFLINPYKRPYTDKERQEIDTYLKQNQIFNKVFLNNVHEQILGRTTDFFRYLLQRGIVGEKQVQGLWNSIPLSDARGRAIVEKLIGDVSKDLPMQFVEQIINKLISLKEVELTLDNLNLLRQLKNREINAEYEQKILGYLWETITEKTINMKENIEEEVEKVFKVFVAGIKDPIIRSQVLVSMLERLDKSKILTNQLDLLKEFLLSYPQKLPMIIDEESDAPLTTADAISYIKKNNIYEKVLLLFENAKKEETIQEFLKFLGFLFEYDKEDISEILKTIYKKLGPTETFLKWIHKISKRASEYMIEMFNSTTQLAPFQNLTLAGFEALEEMIFDINEKLGNLKVLKTKTLPPQTSSTNTNTTGTNTNQQQSQPIGPQLPDEVSHLFVTVSPSQIQGTLFLERLLPILKNSKVYNEVIKILVKFVVCLDDSIENMKGQYRKDFLNHIMKTLSNIIDGNVCDEKIKLTIQAYIQLIVEIFSQTQKQGLSTLEPHFQQVSGQNLKLKIDNTYDKNKTENFELKANENTTVWKFKTLVAEIIGEEAGTINVHKYSDALKDEVNGKTIGELFFNDGQSIRIAKKPPQQIPRFDLFIPNGEQLTPRFVTIVEKWFNEFKTEENVLLMEGMKKLSETHWKGTLFKDPQRLIQVYDQNDEGKKGYLTLAEFTNFFFVKANKNPHAVWRMINLSGYLNNLKHSSEPKIISDVAVLPRRIISCSEVYQIIFRALQNPNFDPVHPNFYRLLTLLEVEAESKSSIKAHAKSIIAESPSLFRVCYTLEVLNSQVAKKNDFFYEFYEQKGLSAIKGRLENFMQAKNSIYSHDAQVKNVIMPNLVKIINMYVTPLFYNIENVRFISRFRINLLDIEDLVKKQKDDKEPEGYSSQMQEIHNKLKATNVPFNTNEWYRTLSSLLHSIISKFSSQSTDFLPKLTNEVARCTAILVLGTQMFNPIELVYGLKSESLNFRRTSSNITYFFMDAHPQFVEQILYELLKEMPTQSKSIYSNYFALLSQIVHSYNKNAPIEKDEFLINLTNELLNKLFDTLRGESRITMISDKVIVGILMTISMLLQRKSVSQALVPRKHEIVSKLLFFYNAKQKLAELQIKPEVLLEQKQPDHFPNYVLCKTQQTRKHAYKIVELIHEVSREKDPHFLQEYVLPVIEDLPNEARKKDQKSLHVGLNNFGSTCYMNSMLQILNFVTPFRNLLMQANVEIPLIEELKQLFSYLFFSERIDYAPRKLLDAFVPPINPGIQQDTTQFLTKLFDETQTALAGSSHRKLLDQIFKGAYAVQMICHSCGAKRQNREEFFSFSVEIDGKYDLGAALDGANQGQVISDFFCESCSNRGDTTKRNLLNQIPSIFFVHLRRIVFNYDMFVNMKIHTRLSFPQQLNVEPYTKQGVELRENLGLEYMKKLKHNEDEQKKFEELTLHGKDKDYYKMKLKGVIVHSGSADVGHYYSIVPNKTNNGWLKLDDSRTTIFATAGFQNQCFGGTWTNEEWGGFGSSTNAYFLIYERITKNPICIYSQMNEPEFVNYDEIKTFNTVERYKEVWLDNHQFLEESHLLQEAHGKRFLQFVCQILKQSQTGNQIKTVCEILYKISMFSGQVGQLGQVFDKNLSQITPQILKNYILADKKKTFNLLFHHQKVVRDLASSVIHGVLIKCYRDGPQEVRGQVVQFIKEQLSNLSGEVAKNWLRIDGYFKLFFRLLASSVEFLQLYQIFVNFGLIATLIDFIMEKASPVRINPKKYSIGTKSHPADFRYGLEIISFLLRRSYGFTGGNFEVPPVPEMYLFHLSNDDVACLSCIDFYEKMLAENQNLEVLGTIIQRLCIKNLPFSKAVIRVVLSTICSITDFKEQMKELSGVAQSILIINDGFWRERAQALLGIGSPYVLGDNGLAILDEERFTFASTLYDIFPVQCLLNYVYLYRLKNPLGCFQIIKAIVRGSSVSEEAMYFLAKQPSCSYYHYNYIDWVCSFVSTFINFVTVDEKRKEKLKEEIDEVNKYLKDLSEFMFNNKDKDFYKTVVTGSIVNEQVVHKIVNEDQKVQLVVKEYQVNCVASEPTAQGNKTLDDLLDGGRITKNLSDESTLLKIMKKPKKALALKMQPVQEDKQLLSLFDTETDPKKTVNAQTTTNSVATELPSSNPQEEPKEEQKIDEQQKKQPEKQQKMEEEPMEEIVNLPGIFSSNYYRQLQIINKSKTSKFVKVIFENELNSNTILPVSLSFKLGFRNSEKIWFSKQIPDQPWCEFKIISKIEDFAKDRKQQQWYKMYGDQKPEFEDGKVMVEQPKKEGNQQPNKNENQKPQENAQIACPACTFINEPGSTMCDVCGGPLPT